MSAFQAATAEGAAMVAAADGALVDAGKRLPSYHQPPD